MNLIDVQGVSDNLYHHFFCMDTEWLSEVEEIIFITENLSELYNGGIRFSGSRVNLGQVWNFYLRERR